MITSDDILSLNFYNYGNPFTGSYQGMRYRIIKQKEAKDEEGNILKEEGLLAVIWPEPFAYEKTQDALKTTQLFPFSEEGKAQVIEWLNASWEEGIYKNETILCDYYRRRSWRYLFSLGNGHEETGIEDCRF